LMIARAIATRCFCPPESVTCSTQVTPQHIQSAIAQAGSQTGTYTSTWPGRKPASQPFAHEAAREGRTPRSPTSVSNPSGSALMKPRALAVSAALVISSSDGACSRRPHPYAMLSAIDPPNTTGSLSFHATHEYHPYHHYHHQHHHHHHCHCCHHCQQHTHCVTTPICPRSHV
jgi:hypothetical protein